jgi:hypothetical protein
MPMMKANFEKWHHKKSAIIEFKILLVQANFSEYSIEYSESEYALPNS